MNQRIYDKLKAVARAGTTITYGEIPPENIKSATRSCLRLSSINRIKRQGRASLP